MIKSAGKNFANSVSSLTKLYVLFAACQGASVNMPRKISIYILSTLLLAKIKVIHIIKYGDNITFRPFSVFHLRLTSKDKVEKAALLTKLSLFVMSCRGLL